MNTSRRPALYLARRDQSGQALVILALGFIGLLSFVGLVTDVSILLVRHNQLVRAVDSAALNAANQMRSDRSFGEVGIAARMMIEMHGFDSEEVLVQTCASLGGEGNTTDQLCNEQNRFRKLVRVGARVNSPTVFLRLLGIQDVELSAVSTSETAVLDVVMVLDVSESMLLDTTYQDWAQIGLGRVYVPPILDSTSGSRAGQSIYEKELARNVFVGRPSNGMFPNAHTDATDQLDDRLQFWAADVHGDVSNYARVWPDQINDRLYYPNDGGASSAPEADQSNISYAVRSFDYPGYGSQTAPREACRVRFWPYSTRRLIEPSIRSIPGYAALWDGTPLTDPEAKWGGFIPSYDFYGCCNDPTTGGQFVYTGATLSGAWQPGTSVNADGRFVDLICQPFKQARDATRAFLETMDFERGDRVALVTFDRGAFLVDPDGAVGSSDVTALGSCPRDPAPAGGRTTLTHMMASFCRAEITLMNHVGVRAEPNFYRWKEDGGGWTGFADGLTVDGRSRPVDYYREGASGGYTADNRAFNQYPVNNNCPMFDATMDGYFSRYSLWNWDITNPYQIGSADAGLRRIMTPRPGQDGWPINLRVDSSYDLRASCRSSNFGAALREANNALLDPTTTRRAGTVWVIIMMSDGSAGASDPVRANGRKLYEANPFRDYGTNPGMWQTHPFTGTTNSIRYGIAGEYGSFGLCPIGVPGGRFGFETGELMDVNENPPEFPYCSDEMPHTRHFCTPPGGDVRAVGKQCFGEGASQLRPGFAPGSKDVDYVCFADTGTPANALPGENQSDYNVRFGNVYDVDIGAVSSRGLMTNAEGNCDLLYDVDDYARDWADYVGLSKSDSGFEQLPTIFTIGFGINFGNGTGSAAENLDDFLGEELLRYIADVGDNSRIDTDYQQDLKQDQQLNGVMNASDDETFGSRGPCEDPDIRPTNGAYSGTVATLMGNGYSTRDGGTGTMIRPLPPRQDCGNYYNAPDQARLQLVFDDIASRMFTRLAP